ncbi:MAG: aa3-type cytochrome c oxidase subunit IV [Sedimentitalea sp.]|nr:aa3-type cytochrome c oxidase subunit IV [Sedimentitalea sp.]
MAEFKHGEMDITEQTRTFDGFMRVVSRFVVACIVLLLFLAIFAT